MHESVADEILAEANLPLLEDWVIVHRATLRQYVLSGYMNHQEIFTSQLKEIDFVKRIAVTLDARYRLGKTIPHPPKKSSGLIEPDS